MNPSIWGQIDPVELPLYEAVTKVKAMLPLIRQDMVAAICAHAALSEADLLVPEMADRSSTSRLTRRALRLDMTATLSRLFEFGYHRRYRQDDRDVASLPFLMRFLEHEEISGYFINQAWGWGDMGMADENEASAADAFQDMYEALEALENDHKAIDILRQVDSFRDTVLAHTVLPHAAPGEMAYAAPPEVSLILPHATGIFSAIELALTGEETGFAQMEAAERAAARIFWRQALNRA